MAPGFPGTGKIHPVDNLAAGPGQRHSAPGPQTSSWQTRQTEKYKPADSIAGLPAQTGFGQRCVEKSGYSQKNEY